MKERPIAELKLLHGERVIIDYDDLPHLERIRWYLNCGYAYGRINHKIISLHSYIIGKAPKGFHIDHINRNKLDNRKENLRIVTARENILNRRSYLKNGNPFFGKNHSEKTKELISKLFSMPVSQYTKDGVFLKRYNSMLKAERETGILNGNISNCVNMKRKTAGGYIWEK